MIRTGRAILMMAALLGAGALLQAQDAPAPGPGPGQGQEFGFHRPPMEKALGPMGTHGRWWSNPDVAAKLNLTDDQKQAMDQILLAHREKLVDLRGNLEKAELAMEPLMQADQPNEAQILAQIDVVAQARAELEKANARFLLALRAKLSPDQWKQLQAIRQQRREMRREGPGAMHRPGTPPPPAGPGGPGGQSMLVAPLEPQFD